MRRLVMTLAAMLLALPFAIAPATVSADETKWVRGKLTAVAGDTITVMVGGKEMKFTVDKETDVVARGAGTATRKAMEEGKGGAQLNQLLKVGQGLEVHYSDASGMMKATEIRAGISVGSGSSSEEKPEGKSASGVVTAVSGDSVTVKSGNREWKFMIDSKTNVVGRGAGTRTRQAQAKGEKTMISDFVGEGDRVIVSFEEMGDAMHASAIRVQVKAPRPKTE